MSGSVFLLAVGTRRSLGESTSRPKSLSLAQKMSVSSLILLHFQQVQDLIEFLAWLSFCDELIEKCPQPVADVWLNML
jgi:hypothetical protein